MLREVIETLTNKATVIFISFNDANQASLAGLSKSGFSYFQILIIMLIFLTLQKGAHINVSNIVLY